MAQGYYLDSYGFPFPVNDFKVIILKYRQPQTCKQLELTVFLFRRKMNYI
jgi:hypothetical protein